MKFYKNDTPEHILVHTLDWYTLSTDQYQDMFLSVTGIGTYYPIHTNSANTTQRPVLYLINL